MTSKNAPNTRLPDTPFRDVLPNVVGTVTQSQVQLDLDANMQAVAKLLAERERLKVGDLNNAQAQNSSARYVLNWTNLQRAFSRLDDLLKKTKTNLPGLATVARATSEFVQLDLPRVGKNVNVRDFYGKDAFPSNDLVIDLDRIVMEWQTGYETFLQSYRTPQRGGKKKTAQRKATLTHK